MEHLFEDLSKEYGRAQWQQDCLVEAEDHMQQMREHIAHWNPAQQREHLEHHHRDRLGKIGDTLRSWNVFSNETDEQAVQRLLLDLRTEQIARCSPGR